MKLIFLLMTFLAFTNPLWAKVLFEVKNGPKETYIKLERESYLLKGPEYSDQVPKNKCTEKIIQNTIKRIELELKKTIPFKEKSALLVKIGNTKKSISSHSKLGQKLAHFSNSIVILKKEVGLSCK